MGGTMTFRRPDGGETTGHLATAGDDADGVVVVQEWWGLNDQIRQTADRFAAAGYRALAPDLYRGRLTTEPDEAGHLMEDLDFADATSQDIRGAVRHLKGLGCKRVAVAGYCLGGALVIAAAVQVAEADAGLCWYGIPPAEVADPAKARVPLQCHFANADDWCTPAAVDDLEKTLRGAGVSHDIHRYDAEHAFFNAESRAYDREAAELSWERAMAFLKRVF